MKLVICGSIKFRKEIEEFAKELKHLGLHHAIVPNFEIAASIGPDELERKDRFKKKELPYIVKAWVNQIRKGDVVFFFNKDGYLGVNTTMQLGVAVGMDKLIGALEPDLEEPCRQIFFDFIASTPTELADYVR